MIPCSTASEANEFQQILRDVEAKFQTEHERVRQWLENKDKMNLPMSQD